MELALDLFVVVAVATFLAVLVFCIHDYLSATRCGDYFPSEWMDEYERKR